MPFLFVGLLALKVGVDGVDEHVGIDAVNGTGLLQVFAVGHYAAKAVHAGTGEYLGNADIGLKDLFDGHIFSNGHCICSFFGGFSVIVYHFGGNFKYFFGESKTIFKKTIILQYANADKRGDLSGKQLKKSYPERYAVFLTVYMFMV